MPDRKNIKQHQGLEDNNNVFRDQTVAVAPSLIATGQESGGGGVGYVSSYRRRILEERQRNKTAKSLQQKVSTTAYCLQSGGMSISSA